MTNVPAEALVAAVGALVPEMRRLAAQRDAAAAFPTDEIDALQQAGLTVAALPPALGGLGLGTVAEGAPALAAILRLLGRGNPSVGRIIEAHVNAVRLLARDATSQQSTTLATLLQEGALLGLWVTDAPGQPLILDGATLRGSKLPCSGAGHVTHALVTVGTGHGTRMALLPTAGLQVRPLAGHTQGMRAAAQGQVAFDGTPLPPGAMFGPAEAYLAEPDLSCGAWRTSAVTVGLLDALLPAFAAALRARSHQDAPLQQERFGLATIQHRTAALWLDHVAPVAEGDTLPVADRIALVNLGRIAIEAACLETMQLVQRGLGLQAFLVGQPVELLCRDLGTYLRQPAPDMVLTEAAAHVLATLP
jgi:alkylation response protein AidB-like acyl-CoA dehydrogenase